MTTKLSLSQRDKIGKYASTGTTWSAQKVSWELKVGEQDLRGTQHILIMNEREYKPPYDTLFHRETYVENHLKLPVRNCTESATNYLGRLGLEELPISIDSSGSCGYDSIYKELISSNRLETISTKALNILNTSEKFPLRHLCQQLLNMDPRGKPWEHLYETHKILQQHKESTDQTINWKNLADGSYWIDHSLMGLLAIALEMDIITKA